MLSAQDLAQLEDGTGGWDVSAAAENLSMPVARELGHDTPKQTGQLENLWEAKNGRVNGTCLGGRVIPGLAKPAFKVFCREHCGAATPRGQLRALGALAPRVGLHKSLSWELFFGGGWRGAGAPVQEPSHCRRDVRALLWQLLQVPLGCFPVCLLFSKEFASTYRKQKARKPPIITQYSVSPRLSEEHLIPLHAAYSPAHGGALAA